MNDIKPEFTVAPFPEEQCDAINQYQLGLLLFPMHPFTAEMRSDLPYRFGDKGILIATTKGLICPDRPDDEPQTWCHPFMSRRTDEVEAPLWYPKQEAFRHLARTAVKCIAEIEGLPAGAADVERAIRRFLSDHWPHLAPNAGAFDSTAPFKILLRCSIDPIHRPSLYRWMNIQNLDPSVVTC